MPAIQLLYVSKTNSEHHQIKNDLMEILTEAVQFNSRNGIMGVLYYGNGYFVQCLEGEEKTVHDIFYTKIIKDPRHQNCEILASKYIDHSLFQRWSMKFAPINKKMKAFFEQHHIDEFNPYLLTHHTTEPFIQLLSEELHQDILHYPQQGYSD